jgi:hypothetical protein
MAQVRRIGSFWGLVALLLTLSMATVAEGQAAIKGSKAASQQAAPPAAETPAPMPDIAPPPPPPDTPPPTIEPGQTKDVMTVAFGQPVKIVKLGVKETYFSKDMKVTLTNGNDSYVE